MKRTNAVYEAPCKKLYHFIASATYLFDVFLVLYLLYLLLHNMLLHQQ